ncbi:uncharacterized protein [Triticum aestivum]|uniref:uncharacterized protein n=1 Tax=Triticum aestivum TaxID=4565 RepID=UPI001D006A4A|nr:uncharacterized protein LOC123063471 [Triticum aestivum]
MTARALGLAGRALLRPLASPGAPRLLSTDKGPLQGLTNAGDPMSRLIMQARNQTDGGFPRHFAENGFTAGGGRMGGNGLTAGDGRMGGNGFTAGDGRVGGNGFTAGDGRMGGNGFTAGGGRMGVTGFTAGGGRSGRFNMEMLRTAGAPRVKRDVLHVTLKGKKTFVTVTDVKGNRKAGASAGCLEDRKGRSRLARYAGEATGEHMGRVANKIGLKSVVVKVKGYSFFRKKKKVIMGFADGFRGERVRTPSPIMYVHDVTQLAHNGCRLPKKVASDNLKQSLSRICMRSSSNSNLRTQQLSDELALVKAELEKSRKEVELAKKGHAEGSELQEAYAKLAEEKKQQALDIEQLKSQLVASHHETKQAIKLLAAFGFSHIGYLTRLSLEVTITKVLPLHPWLNARERKG